MADTIYALATPPGRSGVAVIRVSGPGALESLAYITEDADDIVVRQARLCFLSHPETKEPIDRAVILVFKAPASFTGENVVEYQVHGGSAVIHSLIDALSSRKDHRLAEPGEFTRRAFENGKLDLTEAEAVADLIDAETQIQKNQALAQLDGALSRLYENWRERLTKSLAYMEAEIDFTDEELPEDMNAQRRKILEELAREIDLHLEDNRRGERLRDGIQIAVIGAPNVGKSSLVNLLAQRDIAIVSEHAGTTRDVIEAHLDLGGYPVILADTAGLRPEQLKNSTDGQEAIESEGIRRALKRAQDADILLLMFDATSLPDLDKHTKEMIEENAVVVFNKCDGYKGGFPAIEGQDVLKISARTGVAIDDLIKALTAKIESIIGTREAPSLTRRRHRESLEECYEALNRSLVAELPELMAEDVRLAVRHLGRITGRVDVEDLLDIIFRDFCIGK